MLCQLSYTHFSGASIYAVADTTAVNIGEIKLVWEEPAPPGTRTLVDYAKVLHDVRKRPKSWARIRTFKTRAGAVSARDKLRKANRGSWTFEARPIPNDVIPRVGNEKTVYGLYARYDNSSDPAA